MTLFRATLVVILAAFPTLLSAQSADSRIQAAIERISSAGLPADLLDVRVAEGRAKGVPDQQIADVIERRAEALITASGALSGLAPAISPTDLTAGADAVEAGIPAAAIRQVAQEARSEDRSVAISVLTYLYRERALPLDVAIGDVLAALERGPGALRELPAAAGQPAW